MSITPTLEPTLLQLRIERYQEALRLYEAEPTPEHLTNFTLAAILTADAACAQAPSSSH